MPRRRVIDQIANLSRSLYEERVRPFEEEVPAPLPSRPRRKINMPRRSVRTGRDTTNADPAKREYGEPVYTWAFASSQPRGGFIVNYETRLEEDGTLRCNCMGWVFQRKDKETGLPKPRHCKHLDVVQGEVAGIMRRFRAGEELEKMDAGVPTQTGPRRRLASDEEVQAAQRNDTRIRHGRVITL